MDLTTIDKFEATESDIDASPSKPTPMSLQRGEEHLVRLRSYLRLADDDKVEAAQRLLMVPKALANDALEAIANHSGWSGLAGDGQTEARETQSIGSGEYREVRISGLYRLCEDILEVSLVTQSGAP